MLRLYRLGRLITSWLRSWYASASLARSAYGESERWRAENERLSVENESLVADNRLLSDDLKVAKQQLDMARGTIEVQQMQLEELAEWRAKIIESTRAETAAHARARSKALLTRGVPDEG